MMFTSDGDTQVAEMGPETESRLKSLKVHPNGLYPLKPYTTKVPDRPVLATVATLRVAGNVKTGIREKCVPDLWLQSML